MDPVWFKMATTANQTSKHKNGYYSVNFTKMEVKVWCGGIWEWLTTHIPSLTHTAHNLCLKRFALTVVINLICLLAKYPLNYRTSSNEAFRKQILGICLQIINFKIHLHSRWPPQLTSISQHQTGYNSVTFINVELKIVEIKLNLVVAESLFEHMQLCLRLNIVLFSRFGPKKPRLCHFSSWSQSKTLSSSKKFVI